VGSRVVRVEVFVDVEDEVGEAAVRIGDLGESGSGAVGDESSSGRVVISGEENCGRIS
jgi:hypothetical protein